MRVNEFLLRTFLAISTDRSSIHAVSLILTIVTIPITLGERDVTIRDN